MNIILNGEKVEITEGTRLIDLLEKFSMPVQRIAVELNKIVIKRADWNSITLADEDAIEVVHFVGGG